MNINDKEQQEILSLLIDSWEDFKAYYLSEKDKLWAKINVENNGKEYFVCWKEEDIVLQLSRFFYEKLNTSKLLKDESIQIHTQTKISENTFEDYDFKEKISVLNERLGHKNGHMNGTKPDFIITKEDDYSSLWLIGEVKYFRTWQWKDRVEKDVKELNELKDLNICNRTVYLLGDAFLHEQKNEKEWTELKKILKEEKKRKTRNKIDYLDLMIMCAKKTNECEHNNFAFLQ